MVKIGCAKYLQNMSTFSSIVQFTRVLLVLFVCLFYITVNKEKSGCMDWMCCNQLFIHSFITKFHLDIKEEASQAYWSSVSYKNPSSPKGLSFYTSAIED